MISSCLCMCPGDLTSASVLAAITRPPKKSIRKKIVIVMTSFLINSASYNVYILAYRIIEQ